jgi:hypothetical protein
MRRIIAGSIAMLLTVAAVRAIPAQVEEENDGLVRRFMIACNPDGSAWCGFACDGAPHCCK